MASTLRPARHEFSEDHVRLAGPSHGSSDDLSRPSAYEMGGKGRAAELLSEIKLLAELEKHSGGRAAKTSEPRPVSATKFADLDAEIRRADSKDKQPSLHKRAARGLARVLIIFTMGIAATLGWQSYGDATREMIASSYPQLGWLAPETVPAKSTLETTSSIVSSTTSDSQEKTVAAESIPERTSPIAPDQLAARQQQMANDIATLKAAEQNILRKISSAPPARPAAAPPRKPAPGPPRSPQEPQLR